jgi:hypothetical protein
MRDDNGGTGNSGDTLGIVNSHLNDKTGKKYWMQNDVRKLIDGREDRMLSFVAKKLENLRVEDFTVDSVKSAVGNMKLSESDEKAVISTLEKDGVLDILKEKVDLQRAGGVSVGR